jgi:hypothetical protein
MCHTTSSNLTFHDEFLCHINIHVSCHVIPEAVDGPTVGLVGLEMCYKWLPREMIGSRSVDDRVSAKMVWTFIRQ